MRELLPKDDEVIFRLRSDDQVNKYLGRKKADTIEDARAHMHRVAEGCIKDGLYFWGIEIQEEERLIGTICLWNLDHEKNTAEIGYELLPEWQGKGIMQEALARVIEFSLNEIQLSALTAWTHHENEASSRLLKKNGFRRDLEEENRNANIHPMNIYIRVR